MPAPTPDATLSGDAIAPTAGGPPPPEPAAPERLVLAGDFPPATREQWRELARAVLVKSGAAADVDPELALTRAGIDGVEVAPMYLAEDGPDVMAVTRAPGAWDVRVRHDDPDPARANPAILADLAGGATSVWLRVGPGAIAPADLPRVLDGVYLDLVDVVLDGGAEPAAGVEAVRVLLDAGLAAPTELSGSLGLDPIGAAVRAGTTAVDLQPVTRYATAGVAMATVTVDGSAYHGAGASDVDELAFATAAAVAYLRVLAAEVGTERAFAQIEFRFAVTDQQFPQLAKLRAARRIWARVAELSGCPAAASRQHAVTSAAMMAVRDPWVNLLRTTVAAFAAATAGADAVTVLPFDVAAGRPDALARRIARNTQAVLHDECSLARVLDPAAGSWYVESLTAAMAAKAWARFTEIERAGGMIVALSNGSVAGAIRRSAAERAGRVATRRQPLTGVSEFPNLTEQPLFREPAAADASVHRWAAPFEVLRQRSDDALAETGRRPQVTLLALGSRAGYAGRVGFAGNLFRAGGFETPVITAVADVTSGPVCLCSSDAGYAELAPVAVAAARAAGARLVWLAGPSTAAAAAAVDGFVFTGCDALEVLTRTWSALAEVPA